jgi:c-di-GMP-binding flagellar brake protein YcgR
MASGRTVIDSKDMDFSELVGREVRMRTEQFPGKELTSKVLSVTDDNIIIDRSGSGGLVDELIHNQAVEIMVDYRGEPVIFNSKIAIPSKGKLKIPLAGKLFPVTNREFERIEADLGVRLTYFDDTSILTARLNKLKWIETRTINISGGGMLVEIPSNLTVDFYMILNLGLEGVDLPDLIVGSVRHSRPAMNNLFHIGVEFITRECYQYKLPKSMVRNLPPKLFDFDNKARDDLDIFLVGKYKKV